MRPSGQLAGLKWRLYSQPVVTPISNSAAAEDVGNGDAAWTFFSDAVAVTWAYVHRSMAGRYGASGTLLGGCSVLDRTFR